MSLIQPKHDLTNREIRRPVFINCVHGHELEQHEVEDGSDDGESKEDEEEREEDVEGVCLQRLVLLEGHQVTKTWHRGIRIKDMYKTDLQDEGHLIELGIAGVD